MMVSATDGDSLGKDTLSIDIPAPLTYEIKVRDICVVLFVHLSCFQNDTFISSYEVSIGVF